MTRASLVALAALSVACCIACGRKPRPAPPPPAPPPLAQPIAPPAPSAVVVSGGLVAFDAPPGWQRYDTTGTEYAEMSYGGAVMLMTAIPAGDQLEARRRQAADGLARAVSVAPKGGALRLDAAPQTRAAPAAVLSLWEEPAARSGRDGSLLVFSGPLDAQWHVVGIGFALAGDAAASQQILAALQTIRRR
jgi:hypothetical protein